MRTIQTTVLVQGIAATVDYMIFCIAPVPYNFLVVISRTTNMQI